MFESSKALRALDEEITLEIVSNPAADVDGLATRYCTRRGSYELFVRAQCLICETLLPEANIELGRAVVKLRSLELKELDLAVALAQAELVRSLLPTIELEGRVTVPLGERSQSLLAARKNAEYALQSARDGLRTSELTYEALKAARGINQ